MKIINKDYCKCCQICVEVCPKNAMKDLLPSETAELNFKALEKGYELGEGCEGKLEAEWG